MPEVRLYVEETERELKIRKALPCPVCGAKVGGRCNFGVSTKGTKLWSYVSHTGRYLAGVEAGLVPAFVGAQWIR